VPSAGEEGGTAIASSSDQADVVSVPNGAVGSSLADLASGVGLGNATSPDEIEFLCPNNHLLHGKASMQGRPGICPQCHSKFRIPSYEEYEMPLEQPGGAAGGQTKMPATAPRPLYSPMPDSAVPLGQEIQPTSLNFGNLADGSSPHPLATLFPRLWAYKTMGASLEIHYADSRILAPDRFAPGLSQGSHGVFAVDDTSGTFTLTAVEWASVHTIQLRGVKKLVDETTR
jgi:hypothetical protein